MTTICGHEREMLTWALQVAIKETILDMSGIAIFVQSLGSQLPAIAALAAIGDPSKLAELLTHQGKLLGLYVECEAREKGVTIRTDDGLPLPMYCFRTMPSARTLLAAWLALPDGACEDAEKVLRGGQ